MKHNYPLEPSPLPTPTHPTKTFLDPCLGRLFFYRDKFYLYIKRKTTSSFPYNNFQINFSIYLYLKTFSVYKIMLSQNSTSCKPFMIFSKRIHVLVINDCVFISKINKLEHYNIYVITREIDSIELGNMLRRFVMKIQFR